LTSFRYEHGYLQAGVPELESYLLSEVLYWPLDAKSPPGERPYPRLTLGGLLLARERARALPLSSSQQTELQTLDEQIEAAKTRWRFAWGKKATQSFQARLDLWRNFLEDYKEKPENNANRYSYEVERRVMLHLLTPEIMELQQAYRDMLAGLDMRLRRMLRPGDFIWDPQIASGFPADEYWYLYVSIEAFGVGN
jgi:hypothetical protein